jgi:hypothetical protein
LTAALDVFNVQDPDVVHLLNKIGQEAVIGGGAGAGGRRKPTSTTDSKLWLPSSTRSGARHSRCPAREWSIETSPIGLAHLVDDPTNVRISGFAQVGGFIPMTVGTSVQ